jgi:thiamine biosynthesis lipoprotein
MSEQLIPAPQVNRRQWLRLSLGSGAALAAGTLTAAHDPLIWQDRPLQALGTDLWLRAAHRSAAMADAGLDAAVAAIRHVERHMSLFDANSAVSRLNRDGVLHQPHPDLVRVLRLAQTVSERSQGAFDVTVQPLWNAWFAAQKEGQMPTPQAVAAARARVGWRQLQITDQKISFARPGMGLTLNGIAQGFAADLAQKALRERGIEHALIDTGEWASLGLGPNAAPWTLGVADPRLEGALMASLLMDGRAIATSSDAHYRFAEGDRHHHIFDPRTGYSPPELASVTVAASTCAMADALTKVMFMGSAERALALAQAWGVGVLVIDKAGRQFISPDLKKVIKMA